MQAVISHCLHLKYKFSSYKVQCKRMAEHVSIGYLGIPDICHFTFRDMGHYQFTSRDMGYFGMLTQGYGIYKKINYGDTCQII